MKRIFLFCSLVATIFASCSILEMGSQEGVAEEYKVFQIAKTGIKLHTQMLNSLGQEGWEVDEIEAIVSTSNHKSNGIDVGTRSVTHLFKRHRVENNKLALSPEGYAVWEYKLLTITDKKVDAQVAALNEMGNERWELVGTYTELGPVRSSGKGVHKITTTAINYTANRPQKARISKSLAKKSINKPLTRVEYKIVRVESDEEAETHTKLLNEAGLEQWEMASSYTEVGEKGKRVGSWRAGFIGTKAVNYILKRYIAEPTQQE